MVYGLPVRTRPAILDATVAENNEFVLRL